jgi:hypothetical protein
MSSSSAVVSVRDFDLDGGGVIGAFMDVGGTAEEIVVISACLRLSPVRAFSVLGRSSGSKVRSQASGTEAEGTVIVNAGEASTF